MDLQATPAPDLDPAPQASPAVVISHGCLGTVLGKTTHGLLRGSHRFAVVAVVDRDHAGRDAGEFTDGPPIGIPVVASFDEAVATLPELPRYCVVGVATVGGSMPEVVRDELVAAVMLGVGVVNGLHDLLVDDPRIVALAEATGAELVDIRKPRSRRELHHWTGAIYEVAAPRIAVLGTDSAIGKRTTATVLLHALRARGTRAELIYTGQTGWMQGLSRYGFILDAVVNDFVAGELEHAVVTCSEETRPDVILIEGQSGLRTPTGSGGPVLVRSAAATGAVLHHMPTRTRYLGAPEPHGELLPLAGDVAMLRALGCELLALTLNSASMGDEELAAYEARWAGELEVPVVDPLRHGVGPVVERIGRHVGS